MRGDRGWGDVFTDIQFDQVEERPDRGVYA